MFLLGKSRGFFCFVLFRFVIGGEKEQIPLVYHGFGIEG